MQEIELKQGITLYRIFKECLDEGKDKARLKRLESRLDSWHSKLTLAQKQDFAAILVNQGLVNGPLAAAIKTFHASFVKL